MRQEDETVCSQEGKVRQCDASCFRRRRGAQADRIGREPRNGYGRLDDPFEKRDTAAESSSHRSRRITPARAETSYLRSSTKLVGHEQTDEIGDLPHVTRSFLAR